MQVDDISRCIEIEKNAWVDPEAKEFSFKEKHFLELIKVNPNGQFIIEEKGAVVGFTNTQLIEFNYEDPELKSWEEICNGGLISKTHVPEGDTLFGINLSFSKEASFIASGKLFAYVVSQMMKNGLRSVVLGSRIPSYHKYADEMTAEEYVFAKRKNGKPLDPELHLYKKAGGKFVKVVPNYFPDAQSHNYGVLVMMKNPLYSFIKQKSKTKENNLIKNK
jgi:hypothetical protein